MIILKKILCVTLSVILVLLSLSACGKTENNASVDQKGEEDTRENISEIHSEAESENIQQKNSANGTVYGKDSGTDATLTGFEPLPLTEFKVKDPDNKNQLSTSKISHAYGVAKNETANDISINSQKYFENGQFDAITLDLRTDKKVVYLTFDVGYDNGYTDLILDTLKAKNVTAAFFCTVHEMKTSPDIITRMIKEGHIVGNHTENHPSMDEISRTEMMQEIKGFDDYLRTNYGYSSPYFRFPKGEYSDCALDLVGSLGYTSVFWSLAYADWDTENQKGASYAHDTVVSRIHPGAIILLHAVSSDNAKALGDIIDTAREMGYEFRSLDDYGI